MAEPHVVIIGGGFSGAAVAIHLMQAASRPLNVTVLEPRDTLGAGVAYSTAERTNRINVPASKMQLAGDDDGEFERWYRRQPEFAADPEAERPDRAIYPQRRCFGRYVAERFADVARQSRGRGRLVHIKERAVAWRKPVVLTESGRELHADIVVLAVSHPPPALPRLAVPFVGHQALVENPWHSDSLAGIAPDDRIAIMGSGLTMADVVARLTQQGHHGPITAFSRHGQLPRPNVSGSVPVWEGDYAGGTLAEQLKRIRADIRRAAALNLPWQVVLDAVRNQGQTFWQQLTLRDQQRFLRHLRSHWDVHRYRMAPQVEDVINARRAEGSLRVLAARLTGLSAQSDTLTLTLQHRQGGSQPETVDRLILTTGPAHGSLTESQPVLHDLASRGIIRPDELALGIDVDARSRALGAKGRVAPDLLVAGPAARGRFGELMGLPQVADHAALVAQEVLETLSLSRSA